METTLYTVEYINDEANAYGGYSHIYAHEVKKEGDSIVFYKGGEIEAIFNSSLVFRVTKPTVRPKNPSEPTTKGTL